MKKTMITIASMIFAGSAGASNMFLEDSRDRYSGLNSSTSVATAVQPGVGDSYGGNIFERNDGFGLASTAGDVPAGAGDSYGSSIPNVEQGQLSW